MERVQWTVSVVAINTPEEFAKFIDGKIKDVTCIYLPEDEIPNEPEESDGSHYIPEMKTLKTHMVKRKKTNTAFIYLESFKISSDNRPHYTY